MLSDQVRKVTDEMKKFPGVKSATFRTNRGNVRIAYEIEGVGTRKVSLSNSVFYQSFSSCSYDEIALSLLSQNVEDVIHKVNNNLELFSGDNNPLNDEGVVVERMGFISSALSPSIYVRLAAIDGSFFIDVPLGNPLFYSVESAVKCVVDAISDAKVRTDVVNVREAFKRLFEHYGVEPVGSVDEAFSEIGRFFSLYMGRKIMFYYRAPIDLCGSSVDEMYDMLFMYAPRKHELLNMANESVYSSLRESFNRAFYDEGNVEDFVAETEKAAEFLRNVKAIRAEESQATNV